MAEHRILTTDRAPVRSLVWAGDDLVDWVAGGARYGLDGAARRGPVNYADRFDSAVASNDGKFAVIYERTGTKGLVLRDGKILREIDRSFYQASVYEYPVCLWTREDGRSLLAHCPQEYNRIEIDDAETGERLTESSERTPIDFFHSRLQISPGGARLVSAGWVWHPWDAVQFFDIQQALQDPKTLDLFSGMNPETDHAGAVQECGACWQDDDRLIVAGYEEEFLDEVRDNLDVPSLRPNGLAVYDIQRGKVTRSVVLRRHPGTIMAVAEDWALSFYEHPRLVSLVNGEILEEWPDIPSGIQVSSIIRDYRPPPMALDSVNRRFAVAEDDRIHVVTL